MNKSLSCRCAGKESSEERIGSSVLDQIPFLRGCEDDDEDDSDEEEDFQGMTTDCIDGRKTRSPGARSECLHADKVCMHDPVLLLTACHLCSCRWLENP